METLGCTCTRDFEVIADCDVCSIVSSFYTLHRRFSLPYVSDTRRLNVRQLEIPPFSSRLPMPSGQSQPTAERADPLVPPPSSQMPRLLCAILILLSCVWDRSCNSSPCLEHLPPMSCASRRLPSDANHFRVIRDVSRLPVSCLTTQVFIQIQHRGSPGKRSP